MARLARVEVFAPDEVAVVHVMNRVVRRCFLLGDDLVTGKNYDHRKEWIESLLRRFAASFGIDLLSFAILSNHFHLILRSRPDVVATWDDGEVARWWLMLCPMRKTGDGLPMEPTEPVVSADPWSAVAVDMEFVLGLALIRLKSVMGWGQGVYEDAEFVNIIESRLAGDKPVATIPLYDASKHWKSHKGKN